MTDGTFNGTEISFETFAENTDHWLHIAQDQDVKVLLDEIGDAILVAEDRYERVAVFKDTKNEWEDFQQLQRWKSELPLTRDALEHLSGDCQWRLDSESSLSVVVFGDHWYSKFLRDHEIATAPESDLGNVVVLDDYRPSAPGM